MGERCLIIGAGPAGLTAAYELSKAGVDAVVFEADDVVGGISRTATYRGYRFDIGGHRFFTKVPQVQALWEDILGDEMLVRPRLSRIFYDGRFFDYPLRPMNALRGLGILEAMRVGLSFLSATLFPVRNERNFEEWVSNRFGRRLYEIFFKTYTEKVWGMPCTEIEADWAAQRIKDLDLVKVVREALIGGGRGKTAFTSLIEEFHYPRLGPGMMWERCAELVAERGCRTHLQTAVRRIEHDGTRVTGLVVRDGDGAERVEHGTRVVSSMPVRTLVRALDPAPPDAVLEAASRLRYRDFLTVVLIVRGTDLFPDNWIYIHSPEVHLGRVQNFGNWSPDMVAEPGHSSLGLEYFLQQGDDLWNKDDADLVALGTREMASIGLLDPDTVVDGCVVRMPKAYPVYDATYKDALATIRGYLSGLSNLQLVGRNGQHRYNNQDHSMVTAMLAAQNIQGACRDIWDVNVEQDYHESFLPEETTAGVVSDSAGASGERAVPGRVTGDVDEAMVRDAFARYDTVAMGGAVGTVGGLGLFLATGVLLLKGDGLVGPNLSLLAHFLLGFEVSWPGAFIGLFEGGALGFLFGMVLARLINTVTGIHEGAFRRRIELTRTLDVVTGELE